MGPRQMILAAALVLGGFALAGCEREQETDGVRFEAEIERPRDRETRDLGEEIERGVERTGEEVERTVEDIRESVRD